MKVLADENFPRKAVEALRVGGHDVLWVRTDCPGISDQDVLAKAQAEDRVIVTFDKDFGELAFRSVLPAACGIILFRLRAASSQAASHIILSVLESRPDWRGLFATVDSERLRIRTLPEERLQ